MIELSGVRVHGHEGALLLDDVNLTIGERRVAVIGANGSGKTTLARLLNGLTVPTVGDVRVDGHDTRRARRHVQRRVGFVFQDPDHQIVCPTPREDVALGLRARGVGKREADQIARAALADMGLGDQADQAIHTLSGGEKQLVALCAVLVLQPSWVVMDEPTAALDLPNRRRVIEAIAALPPGVVMVSHDLPLVETFSRAILLDQGRVAADGEPHAVVETYRRAVEG